VSLARKPWLTRFFYRFSFLFVRGLRNRFVSLPTVAANLYGAASYESFLIDEQ
jgi:hypothetical protein